MICQFVLCADHSHRRDARVDDDEERCHFRLLPPVPPTWEILQETCARKEKGLYQSQTTVFLFDPSQAISAQSDK